MAAGATEVGEGRTRKSRETPVPPHLRTCPSPAAHHRRHLKPLSLQAPPLPSPPAETSPCDLRCAKALVPGAFSGTRPIPRRPSLVSSGLGLHGNTSRPSLCLLSYPAGWAEQRSPLSGPDGACTLPATPTPTWASPAAPPARRFLTFAGFILPRFPAEIAARSHAFSRVGQAVPGSAPGQRLPRRPGCLDVGPMVCKRAPTADCRGLVPGSPRHRASLPVPRRTVLRLFYISLQT